MSPRCRREHRRRNEGSGDGLGDDFKKCLCRENSVRRLTGLGDERERGHSKDVLEWGSVEIWVFFRPVRPIFYTYCEANKADPEYDLEDPCNWVRLLQCDEHCVYLVTDPPAAARG